IQADRPHGRVPRRPGSIGSQPLSPTHEEKGNMDRRHLRWAVLLGAVILVAFALAACAQQAPPAQPTAASEEPAAPAESSGESGGESGGQTGQAITLKFLTLDDPDQLLALNAMAQAFKQSDPKWANVTINFAAVPCEPLFPGIEAAVAAGADFEAFLADGPGIKHYAYNSAIIALQDHFTK